MCFSESAGMQLSDNIINNNTLYVRLISQFTITAVSCTSSVDFYPHTRPGTPRQRIDTNESGDET